MERDMKRVWLYFGVTCFFSWLLAGAYLLFGGSTTGGGSGAVSVAYILVPGIVAIIMTKMANGKIRSDLGLYFKPNRWFFVAWLLAPILVLAINEIGFMLPWNEYSEEMPAFFEMIEKSKGADAAEQARQGFEMLPFPVFWLILIQGMIGGLTISAAITLFEELGFYGYAWRSLGRKGLWGSGLFIGLLMGVWAAPLIMLKAGFFDYPVAGMGMMVLYCVLTGPLTLYFRIRSGTVVASAVFTGTLTGLTALPLLYTSGGNNLTVGLTGVPGLFVFCVADVMLFLFDRFVSDEPVGITDEEQDISAGAMESPVVHDTEMESGSGEEA